MAKVIGVRQPEPYTPNAAWVNRSLNEHWDAILDVAPRLRGEPVMPTPSGRRGRKFTFDELGCGYYGCVLDADATDVVFKITSDATEAAFVAAACEIGEFPEGLIRYYALVELPDRYRNRRVFALWREASYDIGFLRRPEDEKDSYRRRLIREGGALLERFFRHARVVNEYMRKAKDVDEAIARMRAREQWAWDYTRDGRVYALSGADKAAVALQHCEDLAEEMDNTALITTVGGALSFYLEHGLLLADVHDNNVGLVDRLPDDDYGERTSAVITDPGLMVPLAPRWLAVSITQVAAA